MTFGPVTIVRPGASIVIAAMGPQGLRGAPGQDGAPGAVGATPWAPLAVWSSGQTYTPSAPSSLVYINGSTFVCRALHTSGAFASDLANGNWQIVASAGPQGVPGTPGSTWYSGSGAPGATVGTNGDYFFRTDTYDVLLKVGGAWAAIANLKGLAGNTVNSGSGAPAPSVGLNGDFYIDFAAWAIYGPKVNGAWPANGQSLIGPSGPGNGSVNPSGATTPGNVAVFGPNGTVIKDGGTLGGAAFLNVGTTPGTVGDGGAVAARLAIQQALAEIAGQGSVYQLAALQNIGGLTPGQALALAITN